MSPTIKSTEAVKNLRASEPKRSRQQQLVNAASVLSFIFSVFLFFASVAQFADVTVYAREIEITTTDESIAMANLVDAFVLWFVSIAALFTGLSGMRAVSHPRKNMLYLISSAIGILAGLVCIGRAVVEGDPIVLVVIFAIALIGPFVFSFITGLQLRKLAQEYQAQGKEFPDPTKSHRYLGFLRVVQVSFALNILMTLTLLIFTSRNAITYTPDRLLEWANLILECLALYFLVRRFKITRWYMVGFAIFNLILDAGIGLATGDILMYAGQLIFDAAVMLYFLTSRRVKYICVEEFDLKGIDRTPDGKFVINRTGWNFVRRLIIYFCVFSLLGHWMEAAMCQLIRLGLVQGEYDPTNTILWRDWFYPYPMEGLAVVLIALFLYPLKEWLVKVIKAPVVPYIISFIANMLVCVCIEFVMGLFVNANLQLWDYSNMPFNLMGQVCLQNALAFGGAASVIAWFVYPLMERWIALIPEEVMRVVFVLILAGYMILQTLYLIEPPGGNTIVESSSSLASVETIPDSEMSANSLSSSGSVASTSSAAASASSVSASTSVSHS